jgi:SAM-dependent methyltransferase
MTFALVVSVLFKKESREERTDWDGANIGTLLMALLAPKPTLFSMAATLGFARRLLYRLYFFVQALIVPNLKNSQYAYRETLKLYVRAKPRWLDLGCGHQLLPEWMPGSEEEQIDILKCAQTAIGIDADWPSLHKHRTLQNKVLGDIGRLPFRDQSFDLITANMVVEHVKDPDELLREVHRALPRNGIFVFHTPNRWSYATLISIVIPAVLKIKLAAFLQNRREEDVFPTFYRMNSREAIRRLAKQHRFDLLEFQLIESSAQTVMLGPVVILELLWIRLLRLPFLKNLRTNIIATLKKAD